MMFGKVMTKKNPLLREKMQLHVTAFPSPYLVKSSFGCVSGKKKKKKEKKLVTDFVLYKEMIFDYH